MNARAPLLRRLVSTTLPFLALALSLPFASSCKDAEWGRFVVITDSSRLPEYVGCRIIPAETMYTATHSQAYGPASEDECREWVDANCE